MKGHIQNNWRKKQNARVTAFENKICVGKLKEKKKWREGQERDDIQRVIPNKGEICHCLNLQGQETSQGSNVELRIDMKRGCPNKINV